jgi:hypothetical protein
MGAPLLAEGASDADARHYQGKFHSELADASQIELRICRLI